MEHTCESCNFVMDVPIYKAGQEHRCPACKKPFMVSDEATCPFRAETVKATAVVCKHCGRDLVEAPEVPESKKGSPILKVLGAILFLGGLLFLVQYYQADTTVATGLGSRVHNIGLIQQRQNGMMMSGGVAAAGFVLVIIGQYLKRE